MIFLLPLIFNPFGFIVRWLPALYLAAWPIIIQTLGRDALLLHAILLITFVLTCDITRGLMHRLIGFDLISTPVGVLILAALLSQKGAKILSYVVPIFGTLLTAVEPLMLIIETLILMDMVKVFNRWISRMSNIRDEDSSDLSDWEPPLTRTSILMRLVIILITVASYLGTYMIIQDAKHLAINEHLSVPIHFNQAISLLVTLQLIALTSTIYTEAGVISESAMVAFAASIPIFIASWSVYHMKMTAASSSWTSYFPFSLFAGPSKALGDGASLGSVTSAGRTDTSGGLLGTGYQERSVVFDDHLDGYQSKDAFGFGTDYNDHHSHQLDYNAFAHLMSPADNIFKKALLAAFRQLIMLINSVLGLSWDQLSKYYFGLDFWYILGGRLVCLVWWIVTGEQQAAGSSDHSSSPSADSDDWAIEERITSGFVRLRTRVRRFNARLPFNRITLIKCLIVLVYAQMLMNEMENKASLTDDTSFLLDGDERALKSGGCCGSSQQSLDGRHNLGVFDSSVNWLRCVWISAKACSGGGSEPLDVQRQQQQAAFGEGGAQTSRASRLLDATMALAGQCLATLLALLAYVYNRVLNAPSIIYHIYALWLIRWRSSIIQRLMQSVFIQIYYICSLLFTNDDDDDD